MSDLGSLRAALDALDEDLVALVARRLALVRAIGQAKIQHGAPTRDFAREREVLLAARTNAERHGVRPDLVEGIVRTLIQGSLEVQEQERVALAGRGEGRRALVIGGAGKMGGWFARFLDSQGWRVEISDPHPGTHWPTIDWRTDPIDHDLIVVATPLEHTNRVLHVLADRKPTGVVFDIGSLKTPLRVGLTRLRDAGVRATSVHPMFGPDTDLLSGRHVVFVDLGLPEATAAAQDLFADTMAVPVQMRLDEHDRAIAYVLGLSHALNITFFTALSRSGEQAERLARMSSTTFDAQLAVSHNVAHESADLYYGIQALNTYGLDALDALVDAAQAVRDVVLRTDPDGFATLMADGRRWFLDR